MERSILKKAQNYIRGAGKRLLHPVVLLPVLTNIPQLLLYIRYGGVLNNLWEVGLTTVTAAFCLRELVLYRKTREDSAALAMVKVVSASPEA